MSRLTTQQVGAVVSAIAAGRLIMDEAEFKGPYAYIGAGGYDLEVALSAPQEVNSCITPGGNGYSHTLDGGSVRDGLLAWVWRDFINLINLKKHAEPKVLELEVLPPSLSTENPEWEVVPMWHVKKKGETLKAHHVSYEYFASEQEALNRAERLTKENAAYAATTKTKPRKKK